MLKDVRFLEVHTEVFFAGKNFGKKFVMKNIPGLSLKWNDTEKWFELTWNKRKGIIFPTNCSVCEFEDGVEVKMPVNEHKTEDKSKRSKAQVSTPQSHVFSTAPGMR